MAKSVIAAASANLVKAIPNLSPFLEQHNYTSKCRLCSRYETVRTDQAVSPLRRGFLLKLTPDLKRSPAISGGAFAAVSTSVICRVARQLRLGDAIVRNDATFALETSDLRSIDVARPVTFSKRSMTRHRRPISTSARAARHCDPVIIDQHLINVRSAYDWRRSFI